jgi:hypothetical protein
LPNLRSAFLQKVLGVAYALNEPVILDGAVSRSLDQSVRNAELIPFVNW